MTLSKSPDAIKLDPRYLTTNSDRIGNEKNPVSRSKLEDDE